jgi:hypothetical protein
MRFSRSFSQLYPQRTKSHSGTEAILAQKLSPNHAQN